MKKVIYDATLREGAQCANASFSVNDKLKIVEMLDELGVGYIEAGNPSSNPKDKEFFDFIKDYKFKTAKLVAFGATARKGNLPKDDAGIKALVDANTDYVAVFGKSWDFHATNIIGISLEENLEIIRSTVEYLTSLGKKVFFDAEHFFDGYKENSDYAMEALAAAKEGGAFNLVLCDTNGGCFPSEIAKITKEVVDRFGDMVSIHCHNDTGMACANTVEAINNGAQMAQVTIGGIGERCGNADLCIILPDLQIKLGYTCVEPDKLKTLHQFSRKFSEIANIKVDEKTPFVGANAFMHKAGMHIDGVNKNPKSFEHMNPELIGQSRKFVLSEVAGRVAVINKAKHIIPDINKNSPEAAKILQELKELENQGYVFEGAEASFELVIRKIAGLYTPKFSVKEYKVITDKPEGIGSGPAYAMAEIQVGDETEINAAKGNGPVNSLDKALRKALERFYPCLKDVHLTDYKVRVLDSKLASASKVRVLMESSDGEKTWSTVGVSDDIITASYLALLDSIEYKLESE